MYQEYTGEVKIKNESKNLMISKDELIEKQQEEIKGLNAELELYKDNQIHLINQLEQKDKIIKEALRKLRASKDHFKTEQENNAVTFTIKILEEGDKK